jgi:hypothetical protein
MFLCVAQLPAGIDAARVAGALGMAAPDVAHRLAGVLPRVLHSDADGARVDAFVARLTTLGVVAFALDPRRALDDSDRIVARTLTLGADLVVEDRGGRLHAVPWSSLMLLQRGARVASSTETVKTKTRELSLGRAIVTGGISVSKKVERVEERTATTREPFLVLQRSDGLPDVMLYERRLDYRFLPKPVASSFQNLELTERALLDRAPHAVKDLRLMRPGFLTGMLGARADAVDVGLELVRTAFLHGA